MTDNHRKIIKFIKSTRESFPDASIIYRYGACYGLYKMLKVVFPTSKAFITEDGLHIATQIGGKMYDINGQSSEENLRRIDADEHDHWDGVVYGQRVEHMIRKLD